MGGEVVESAIPRLLSEREAARVLGIPINIMRKMRKERAITYYQLSERIVAYHPADVLRLCQHNSGDYILDIRRPPMGVSRSMADGGGNRARAELS